MSVTIGGTFAGTDKRQITHEITEGATAGEIIEELLESSVIRFQGDEGENKIDKFFSISLILLNGKNIRYLEGLNTVISENDTMVILKPMVGG
jgi:molybdopterin converting factor small subunit